MSRLPADARDPLLERDLEQRALVEVLERAGAGIGGLVVVEGPAGIGKTQLLDSARQDALDRSLTIGRARGGSLEQDVSFGVVRQLFEPLIAASGDANALFAGGAAAAAPVFGRPATGVGDEDTGPGTVLHGLYWLTVALAERNAPLVLLLDDAHWFDGPSLRFVAYLVNRIDELPVALVMATRPAEPGPEGELLARLLTYQGICRLRLAPLTRDAVGELVRRTIDDTAANAFCDAVAEASNGNPFLVTELVRAALTTGAETLTATS